MVSGHWTDGSSGTFQVRESCHEKKLFTSSNSNSLADNFRTSSLEAALKSCEIHILLTSYYKYNDGCWTGHTGPPQEWLTGNILEHMKLGGIFAAHQKYAREYGPIFVACNVHKPIVMVESPELARKVLSRVRYTNSESTPVCHPVLFCCSKGSFGSGGHASFLPNKMSHALKFGSTTLACKDACIPLLHVSRLVTFSSYLKLSGQVRQAGTGFTRSIADRYFLESLLGPQNLAFGPICVTKMACLPNRCCCRTTTAAFFPTYFTARTPSLRRALTWTLAATSTRRCAAPGSPSSSPAGTPSPSCLPLRFRNS